MESKLPTRKALSTVAQNSRLPAPSSRLKPPSQITKRSRSPEEAPAAKRQRTSQEAFPKKPATGASKLRPSNSTGNLTQTKPSTLKNGIKQTSGSNLKTGTTKSFIRPVTAKPPPRTEKRNRKNWNKASETCIFISCDSNTTSEIEGDVEAPFDIGSELDEVVVKNCFNNVKNVSLFSDEEDSVSGLQFESDFIDEIERHADIGNTSLSLTVVSCCKGVVNATCNCKICQTATREENKQAQSSHEINKLNNEDSNDTLEEFAREVKARSLIPTATSRLRAGVVALTPAPVKRSKSKKGKTNTNTNTISNKIELKSDNKLEHTETDGDVKVDGLPHVNKSSFIYKDPNCTETVIDKPILIHDLELEIGNGKIVEDKKTPTVSKEPSLSKSCHDFEDSEPECAQHEKKKAQICSEIEVEKMQLTGLALQNKKLGNDQIKAFITNGERNSSKSNIATLAYKTKTQSNSPCSKAVKSDRLSSTLPKERIISYDQSHIPVSSTEPRKRSSSNERSPVRSQIPVSTSPRRCRGSLSPVHNAPSQFCESSQSPVHNTLRNSDSLTSKLPPKSPVYSRNSPTVTKRLPLSSRANSASPYCVSVKSPSAQTSADKSSSSLKKLTSLAQKQIQVLKSNSPITLTDRSKSRYKSGSSIPKLVLGSQACPQLTDIDGTSKRNLPRAPEKRTVRYGQRCMPDGDIQTPGNAVSKKPTAVASKPVSAPSNAPSKKRPAWDVKGRLQDMEEQMEKKISQMKEWSDRIELLENRNTELSGTVSRKEEIASNVGKEKESLQHRLREKENQLETIETKLKRDTENFEFTIASLRRQKDALESELNALQTEAAGLKSSIAQLTSAQAGLKSELTSTQVSLNKALNENQEKDEKITQLMGIIANNKQTKAEDDEKIRNFETERRKLHNTIQELKGNIRVFCRVRPLIGDELLGTDGEIQHIHFPDEDGKTLELEKRTDMCLNESTLNATRSSGNGRYTFSFDRVFSPSCTQAEVFEEISQLVQSALDGYNVCIFAYGQTGSGKTYTMEGPSVEDEVTMGMISRATIQIFQTTEDLVDKGWQYEFEASFLEIYNETIRDLLGNHGPNIKHDITQGNGGKDTSVSNLTTQIVTRREQIVNLLRTASKNRAVGKTMCNERSSRSHSVFRLKIKGCNGITGETCAGTLNLVDLAGSERLKESEATGQRLKETQKINSSLSELGNVIMALGNKKSHVPYRNSKLTFLLQNSLGGNSKTLMFVNVSPKEDHCSESINSLRFATKVNQCNIGTATKKTE